MRGGAPAAAKNIKLLLRYTVHLYREYTQEAVTMHRVRPMGKQLQLSALANKRFKS